MADTMPSSIEQRMMEEAKNDVRETGQFLTAQELAEFFNSDLADLQTCLNEWVTRGEIFSILDGSAGELFPVFAFERSHGIRPFDAIAKVLSIFGDRLSDWGIASWFIGLNSFLDDQCPRDLVGEDPEWVIEAARDEMEECSHG